MIRNVTVKKLHQQKTYKKNEIYNCISINKNKPLLPNVLKLNNFIKRYSAYPLEHTTKLNRV